MIATPSPKELATIHASVGHYIMLPGYLWDWATSAAARAELVNATRNGVMVLATPCRVVTEEMDDAMRKTGWEHMGFGYRLTQI